MSHPEELLAGYVDGTLERPEREVVDTHLSACSRCREEIDLAQRAVAATGELEEVPVPFGVSGPVLAEAGRRFEGRRARRWERLRWAAGVAAAASLVLVVVLNLGDGTDKAFSPATQDQAGSEAPAPAASEAASGALAFAGLERQLGVAYDDEGIRSLARDASAAFRGEPRSAEIGRVFSAPDRALACVATSGGPTGDPRDTLVRLIEAEYQGTPAFLAVFAEGPGAAQPPDTIVVWVASTSDCSFLTGASLRI